MYLRHRTDVTQTKKPKTRVYISFLAFSVAVIKGLSRPRVESGRGGAIGGCYDR
jgi:hypothetical protein